MCPGAPADVYMHVKVLVNQESQVLTSCDTLEGQDTLRDDLLAKMSTKDGVDTVASVKKLTKWRAVF